MLTTQNFDVELLRVYDRDALFEPCEREETRFWDDLKEADEKDPRGKGLFFRIIGATGRSVGNPPEAGDYPQHRIGRRVECSVTSSQIAATLEISSKFLDASQDDGSYSGDGEHDGIMETTRNLYQYADVLLGCGHGTGRLAVIDANASATDTIVCAMAVMAFQLREWQTFDIVDTDTGGTPQFTNVQILAIDFVTGTLTLDQNVTVVAGWGIYQADVYGNPMPNGLRNIVDDGDFASTLFNASRDSNPVLNATVLDGNGGLQDYSEDLIRDGLSQGGNRNDSTPTQLRCNYGIIGEHYRVTVPDRVYMVTSDKLPNYGTGANQEAITFTYGDKKIPFRPDRNLPARELYGLHRPSWRKHTLRKADWFKGPGGGILSIRPADGGGTLSFALTGAMLLDMTISCRRPNANVKWSNIRDRSAARDS
jgi:hypothetical protein